MKLFKVTQVFVLPGWESSRGAQLEVHVARSLELPVVPVPEPVDPDAAAVEAIIAAVYLDRGMEAARHFVLDHLHSTRQWNGLREISGGIVVQFHARDKAQ